MSIRVLIVDDSALMRRLIGDILRSDPAIEVVGTASDGVQGVAMTERLKPDVVTMDVQMPAGGGLTALAEIMRRCPTKVVMVSTLTTKGAAATLEALELGAFDFVAKPSGTILSLDAIREELLAKVKAAAGSRLQAPRPAAVVRAPAPVRATDRVVLVASSTGGPRALTVLFESLPKNLGAPMLVVQHMPAGFTKSLAERLTALRTVPCFEAADGKPLEPGVAWLAPGGRHMVLGPDGRIRLTDDPPVHGVRPAADPLFLSAAKLLGSRCLAVVLTGMGRDGADGALAIRKAAGTVLAESESTATVYGMPKAATAIGATHAEYPIHEMGQAIVANLQRRIAHAS